MACPPITFQGIDEEAFKDLKDHLTQYGLNIPMAHEGMITGTGVAAEFKWNESTGTLWVQLQRKPIFVSCGYIYDKLKEAVGSDDVS